MSKKNKSRVKRVPQKKKVNEEIGAVGRALRALGGIGGGALGSYAGNPVAGSAMGTGLGAALSKWMGFGDYAVESNSVVKRASTGVPMMHKEGQSIVVRHREYIAQVRGTQSFTRQDSFELNPGNVKTFPWLSSIAASFQEYTFKGIVFHYIPSSGAAVASTNAALGTVMLQTSYRSNDSPPSSKTELLNEYWSGESVPSETFAHPIECNPAENPFNVQYVRTTDVPTGDSQLLYDLGVTHLCTAGQQADGNTLGDLWVTYEVELRKPIVASNVTSRIQLTSTQFSSPTTTAMFAGPRLESGNLGLTGSTSGHVLTMDSGARGRFMCNFILLGTLGAIVFPTTIALTNATIVSLSPDLLSGLVRNQAGGTSPSLINGFFAFAFTVTDPTLPVVFTLTGVTLPTAPTSTVVNITPF